MVVRNLTEQFSLAFLTTVVGLPVSAVLRTMLLVTNARIKDRTAAQAVATQAQGRMTMRFLLFNLVVVGALYYLFTADHADIQNVAANAHATVDKVERMATTAVDTVDAVPESIRDRLAKVSHIESKPVPERPEPFETTAVADAPPPPPAAPEDLAAAETPVPVKAAPEPVVAEAPVRAIPVAEGPAPKATPAPQPAAEQTAPAPVAPTNRPRMLAAEDLPVTEVAALPVHKADPATAAPAPKAVAMAPAAPSAPATAPAKKAEVAIAEGETLMSPAQRRKQLFALAEDMEMFFIDRAGK